LHDVLHTATQIVLEHIHQLYVHEIYNAMKIGLTERNCTKT